MRNTKPRFTGDGLVMGPFQAKNHRRKVRRSIKTIQHRPLTPASLNALHRVAAAPPRTCLGCDGPVMDTLACPSIRSHCVLCCGCPEHQDT